MPNALATARAVACPLHGSAMRRSVTISVILALSSLACGGRSARREVPAGTRPPAVGSARSEVIEFDGVRVEQMDLGAARIGTNRFRAVVTNETDEPVSLGLELRATAGQWVVSGWQRAFRFPIAPRERRTIEAEYTFRRLTPEGALRVTFGPPVEHASGALAVDQPFFRKWYPVGRDNPVAVDLRASFTRRVTPHVEIYAYKGSAAERHLETLVQERDSAIATIASLLGVDFRKRIRLVFYPDSATKTTQTGHVGMGSASGTTIIEIFTETERLDPFHEVAHIVAGEVGNPPAMLDEGFATYVSERLGADALAYLGGAGKRVTQVTCEMAAAKRLLPLDSLLHFREIGSPGTQADVSYPQSAALVKYLVEERGIDKFRMAYRTLVSTSDPEGWRENARALERIYGTRPEQLENDWLTWLGCR